jgi:hypothetical protein
VIEDNRYVVPSGDGKGQAILIDLEAIIRAENRLMEVQSVNAHKAPELLAVFNKSWADLKRVYTAVQWERNKADLRLQTLTSEAILDVTEEALKKRGHSKASADLRKAMASIDPRVIEATETLNEIRAIQDFLHGKMIAFENAFTSVKRIVQIDRLPGGTAPALHGIPQPQQQSTQDGIFGTPRY